MPVAMNEFGIMSGMTVKCPICPHGCRLAEGRTGICRARRNVGGRIVPLAYGRPCSIAIDPMEKKPLFHFLPGRQVLSLGMAGCNLRCRNCQNASISQACPKDIPGHALSPKELVALVKAKGLSAVAYTYTEPIVAFEYVLECAKAVHGAGFANVLVSAGYVNPEPLAELLPFLDAANVDLKTMSEKGYLENCGAKRDPVLATLRTLAKSKVVLEVTNLVIPGFNDSAPDLQAWCAFVSKELGRDVPVHFSRFFPAHLMTDRPPTPVGTLHLARKIANDHGLKYVYCGNVDEEENTVCPDCGACLVSRRGYHARVGIGKDGRCPRCGRVIYGRF